MISGDNNLSDLVRSAFRPHLVAGEEIAVFETVLADFSVGFPHMFVKAPMTSAELGDKARVKFVLSQLRELRATFAQEARKLAGGDESSRQLFSIEGTPSMMIAGDIAGAWIAALLWEEHHLPSSADGQVT